MTGPSSVIVWQGPSELDGAPVALVMTGLTRRSANEKTGAMIQTWIVRSDIHPLEAVKTGADSAICGDCPLRPALADGGPRCYVRTGNAPAAVYRTLPSYPEVSLEHACQLIRESGLPLRLGAYGDPAAIPPKVIKALHKAAGGRNTGYTHQWRKARLQGSCLASVGSPAEAAEAHKRGYRTFRVRRADEPLLAGEITCPASEEAGKRTSCSKCRLCNGTKPGDKRKSIAIIDHGPTAPRKALKTV